MSYNHQRQALGVISNQYISIAHNNNTAITNNASNDTASLLKQQPHHTFTKSTHPSQLNTVFNGGEKNERQCNAAQEKKAADNEELFDEFEIFKDKENAAASIKKFVESAVVSDFDDEEDQEDEAEEDEEEDYGQDYYGRDDDDGEEEDEEAILDEDEEGKENFCKLP